MTRRTVNTGLAAAHRRQWQDRLTSRNARQGFIGLIQ
jgi:hypothetical protein